MQKDALVSVIIPTYNRGYILPTAIHSVLAQTYNNWELLIVDDGSTDNTGEIAKTLDNTRIHYYSQANKGAAAARNFGVSKAKGKWVAYLDSDNELLPEYLQTMLQWIDRHPQTIFAIPRARRTQELYENGELVKSIDQSDNTPPHATLKDIFEYTVNFDTNGFMHLRSIFDKKIRWDESLPRMEDWDIAMTIGEQYPEGFLYVPEVLYIYHQRFGGDGLVSNTTYSDWAETFERIYQKHKHNKLLADQTWYPTKVEKWQRLQKEFEAGKLPPYYRYYFERKS